MAIPVSSTIAQFECQKALTMLISLSVSDTDGWLECWFVLPWFLIASKHLYSLNIVDLHNESSLNAPFNRS